MDADSTVGRWLQEAELGDPATRRRLLVLHAKLAMRLTRWEEASRRWHLVAEHEHDLDPRSDRLLALAVCRSKAGDPEAAETWLARLEALEAAGRRRRRKVAVYRRKALERALGGWRAHRAAGEVMAAVADRRAEDARQALECALEACGASPRVATLARACVEAMIAPERIDLSRVREGGHRGLVLVSGFGWSGCGAVVDWLADHEGVSVPLGGGFEPALLERSGGIRDLLGTASGSDRDRRRALAQFLLGPVVGLYDCAGEGPKLTWRRSLARRFRDEPAAMSALQGACEALAADWERAAGEETEELIQAFLRRVPGLSDWGGAGLRVLNNILHSQRLELLRLLPKARAVAVIRDPRDQFVARRLEGRRDSDVDSFCRSLAGKARRFNRAVAAPGMAERIRVVGFEDFVSSVRSRQQLADWLGELGQVTAPGGERRFDPQESAANIAIFHRYLSPEERREIEQACGELEFGGHSPF